MKRRDLLRGGSLVLCLGATDLVFGASVDHSVTHYAASGELGNLLPNAPKSAVVRLAT